MKKPLSKTQTSVLAALKRNGYWSRNCGWFWTGEKATVQHLDSLVTRGLVTRDDTGTYRPA